MPKAASNANTMPAAPVTNSNPMFQRGQVVMMRSDSMVRTSGQQQHHGQQPELQQAVMPRSHSMVRTSGQQLELQQVQQQGFQRSASLVRTPAQQDALMASQVQRSGSMVRTPAQQQDALLASVLTTNTPSLVPPVMLQGMQQSSQPVAQPPQNLAQQDALLAGVITTSSPSLVPPVMFQGSQQLADALLAGVVTTAAPSQVPPVMLQGSPQPGVLLSQFATQAAQQAQQFAQQVQAQAPVQDVLISSQTHFAPLPRASSMYRTPDQQTPVAAVLQRTPSMYRTPAEQQACVAPSLPRASSMYRTPAEQQASLAPPQFVLVNQPQTPADGVHGPSFPRSSSLYRTRMPAEQQGMATQPLNRSLKMQLPAQQGSLIAPPQGFSYAPGAYEAEFPPRDGDEMMLVYQPAPAPVPVYTPTMAKAPSRSLNQSATSVNVPPHNKVMAAPTFSGGPAFARGRSPPPSKLQQMRARDVYERMQVVNI
jgi:hypothetical protein